MANRNLELSIISAKDLSEVNLFAKMDVYAYVSISGDSQKRQKTPVDHEGGKNPTWNFTAKFTIDESAAKRDQATVVFQLKDQQMLGDKDIGEVRVPLKELLENADKPIQFVSYQVSKPAGGAKGQLNISYKFSEKIASAAGYQAPMPAYNAAPVQVLEPYKVNSVPITAYPVVQAAGVPITAYPVVQAAGGSSSGYDQQNSCMPYPHLDTASYPPPPQPQQAVAYPPQPLAEYGYLLPLAPQHGAYPPPAPQPGAEHGYQPLPPQYEGYPPHPDYGYPPPQPGYGFYPPPPQQPGYGYPPPNQNGYGYPPAQPGYGYPPGY